MLKLEKLDNTKMVGIKGACPNCHMKNSSVIMDYHHNKVDFLNSILKIRCFACDSAHKKKMRDVTTEVDRQNDD